MSNAGGVAVAVVREYPYPTAPGPKGNWNAVKYIQGNCLHLTERVLMRQLRVQLTLHSRSPSIHPGSSDRRNSHYRTRRRR